MKHELYDDVMLLEDGGNDPLAQGLAMQRMIDRGMWGLQGSFGRAMMDAIESGSAMLGKKSAKDYYGNRIPARDEVEPGTKGSREYVVARMGEAWAEAMEGA